MTPRERLKKLLVELSFQKKRVVLSSGKKSNFYFDGKQTALHPEGAFVIGWLLFDRIRETFPTAKAVGGMTLGADPLISAVVLTSYLESSPMPGFIIRKEPKPHGTQVWIEGFKNIKRGTEVVLLEDVMTTGGSILKAIDRSEAAGLKIAGVVVVVDRGEGGGDTLRKRGVQLEALFTMKDFNIK